MISVNNISLLIKHLSATWKNISKNWLIALVNKFVLVIFVLSLGIIIWRFGLLPPQVPLWYDKPWGNDQLAGPIWLFILPIGSLSIYFINILLSIYFSSDLLIFSQTLSLTSLTVSLMSFITLIKIIFLVT